MKSFICFILLAPFLLLACKKDKGEVLPSPSTTGANTFGCRIDGQVFVPKKRGGFQPPNPISCGSIFKNGSWNNLYISITNAEKKMLVDLLVLDCPRKGRYALGSTPGTYFEVREVRSYGGVVQGDGGPGSDWYLTADDAPGYIDITRLDTTARVVSGTFAFKATQRGTGKQVSVTEGSFDLKLGQ